MSLETQATQTSHSDAVLRYANHPFATDDVYLQGLSGIVSNGTVEGLDDEGRQRVLRKTRVFYFNQLTGSSITEEEAEAAEGTRRTHADSTSPVSLSNTTDLSGTPNEESRTLSFAELQLLIEQGKTDQIPNNKHIPEELNEAPPSQSISNTRRKPWEAAVVAATPEDS
ncbi:hypothetical protein FA95DRAFT_1504616 [Auriscalpium vulgare]|uniref:Uncharacterized protein n=1 Tax=Auriscalpium vulgare TaxID=40419 RepID=A0ACB8R6A4_9AGAM|nr:hypothetical protein FA95DRAFT_1504616 [Auriscalpium vulgare]